MRIGNILHCKIPAACLFLSLAAIATSAQTQGRMTIQATAMGTGTQMGKLVHINIHIEELSTQNDQKTLFDAFLRHGQTALVKALYQMKSKGRVRFASGGVGNDVKYIIELPSDKGRRLRLITDRYLSFAELYYTPRSNSYDVGVIELNLTPDGKGSGTLLPACRMTVNKKKKEMEVETYQNPWKLTNLMISNN